MNEGASGGRIKEEFTRCYLISLEMGIQRKGLVFLGGDEGRKNTPVEGGFHCAIRKRGSGSEMKESQRCIRWPMSIGL